MEIVSETRNKGSMAQRSLGISAPEGTDVYEVYVKVRSRTAGMGKLVELLGEHNAEILGIYANYSQQDKLFHVILYLEMCNASKKMRDLLFTLEAQEFVASAAAESKYMMHFESMLFPIVRGGSYRVFVLGADEWIHLLEAFSLKFGTAASALLHEQGVSIGETMAERLGDRFRAPVTAQALERDFIGLIRAAGMGRLHVSGTRFGFVVKIEDSVVSGSQQGLVDNFLVGVVTGALGKMNASRYAVTDLLRSRDSVITFRLTPMH